jgi:hypothetical protein
MHIGNADEMVVYFDMHCDTEDANEVEIRSQLQSLDVSVNIPVNDYLRKDYDVSLTCEHAPRTPYGEMKRTSASELAECVSAAWKQIARKTVQQSFKKRCIKSARDGTEDDSDFEN